MPETAVETPKYPERRTVDWADLSHRAKQVLLERGTTGNYYFLTYEDDLIIIRFQRRWKNHEGYLEVTRKKMPGHPDGEHVHDTSNPFYMEVGGRCIRVHGEGIYVYQHLIDLTRGEEGSWRESKD